MASGKHPALFGKDRLETIKSDVTGYEMYKEPVANAMSYV